VLINGSHSVFRLKNRKQINVKNFLFVLIFSGVILNGIRRENDRFFYFCCRNFQTIMIYHYDKRINNELQSDEWFSAIVTIKTMK